LAIVQDDAGLLFRFVEAARWQVKLCGDYERPCGSFHIGCGFWRATPNLLLPRRKGN
jgi:hypothetical protein